MHNQNVIKNDKKPSLINKNEISNKDIFEYNNNHKENNNEIIFLTSNDINLKCNFCQNNLEGIIYYCKQCRTFFCSNCEKSNGIKHSHCYYKIRNKEQLKEINNYHKNNNKNYTNNNNNSIHDSYNISDKLNKVGEVISKGTNFLGNTMNNVANFLAFKESLNMSNLLNHGLKYINNNYNNRNNNNNIRNIGNNRINNYYNPNNHISNSRQSNSNENTDLQYLVRKAKMRYNLDTFGDQEIERAIILSEGNIDNAISLLLTSQE